MKKVFLIFEVAVLMAGLLAGCGNETNEADETDKTATQESLYEETDSWETEESLSQKKENESDISPFLCKKVEEGYELTIYNSSGAIILSEVYLKEPGISWVTENVMEIAISVGSPARYVYYIDLDEDKVSDVYFNPTLVGDKYVAYMEEGKLILSDIFYTDKQEGLLYMTIDRDFYETADPMSAIMGIEPIDSENIELTYLTGGDYAEVTEIIPIDKDMDTEQSGITDSP